MADHADSRHTQGPWRIGNLESFDAYTGLPFRNVWSGPSGTAIVVARCIDNRNCDDDALLISAAPDLLAACELAASTLCMAELTPFVRGNLVKALDKAI